MKKTNPKSNHLKYIKSASKIDVINWWDISENIKLKLRTYPKEIKKLGDLITVRRLKSISDKGSMNKNICGIKKELGKNTILKLQFPIQLKNMDYVRLYALMTSEGSYNTEFSLNVPEQEFHDIFKESISKLISTSAAEMIKYDYNKGFLRSRAPAILNRLIPFPEMIPNSIMTNKEFAREYLRIAFEAEGSPIYDAGSKRYIKLSRYCDITDYVSTNLPIQKRIFVGTLERDYKNLLNKIRDKPPLLLLGEHILLQRHFNIDSNIKLEAIRHNKTGYRAGKISARWVLTIYANNIDKYIEKIGFLSAKKNYILTQMKKIRSNNPQYSTIDVIKSIMNSKYIFKRKKFVSKMHKLGYKSPSAFLWRYEKKGLIRRLDKGIYELSSK
ncbi:hypothetical protein BVX95_01660 [archaeon D22]|nr:hypothetical protein BVX95_01660 [archaeon D22]